MRYDVVIVHAARTWPECMIDFNLRSSSLQDRTLAFGDYVTLPLPLPGAPGHRPGMTIVIPYGAQPACVAAEHKHRLFH